MNQLNDTRTAMRVSKITILINIVLSIFKFAAGILAHSGAMISDAVHSASDVLSTLVVMAGFKLAKKDPDHCHPYGHERFECVASLILAAILFATGLGIGWVGIQKIFAQSPSELTVPGALALTAAFVSIVVKEWMYWYTRAAAKKIHSGALMADAWHHRSDALSSIGSLLGILGARMGLPVLDPIASLVICLFIVKAAYSIFQDSISRMTDHSCKPELSKRIEALVTSQSGVIKLDDMKSRMFGSMIYVDVEISADGSQTLESAHHIAEQIHQAVEITFPEVKHCMVHVNPLADFPQNAAMY